MAPKPSGILAAHPEYEKWMQIREAAIPNRQIPIARTKELIPQLSALPGLAPADYTGQLDEAGKMAKLQLGLALAARGFGSMGAQPRAGEMPVSTLGRELLSPLAGDAMAVGQQYYDQKLKLTAAEKAQQAGLTQAALSLAQAEQAGDISFKEKLLLDLAGKTAKTTIKEIDNLQIKVGDDWVPSPGFSITDTAGTTVFRGPNNEVLSFTGEDPNARIFTDPEGSQYETSESRAIKITPETLALVQEKFGVTLDPELVGQKAFIQTYNPKGDYPDLESYSKLQIAAETFDLRKPLKDQTITPTELANASEAWAEDDKDTYKGHLVVVDNKTGLARVDDAGKRVQVTLGPGNQLFRFGTHKPYTQPDNTLLQSLADYDAAKAATADAATAREERRTLDRDAMYGQMLTFQNAQIGITKPYARNSALYFDLGQYMKDGFGFKHVVDFDNRELDEEITDPKIREWLTNRAHGILEQRVKGIEDLSDTQGQHKLRAAMADILKFTQADYTSMMGAVSPDPEEPAQPPSDVINRRAGEEAIQILKTSDQPPAQVFSAVTRPRTRPNMNSTWGKLWVAEESFPETFSQYNVANVDANQRRADIEAALPKIQFDLNKETPDHRQKILDAANKIAEERNNLQTKPSSLEAEEQVSNQLIFRQALLDFENAALAAGNVTGFITGRLVKGAVAIGMGKFIQGAGKDAYERLVAASEELERGWSRQRGRTEFLDTRISNYDAMEYKQLVNKITSSTEYNRVLVQQGLERVDRNLTNWMDLAGRVGYSERILNEVAKTGVDFSALKTRNNWDGYGYFGKNTFVTSGQSMPGLSAEQMEAMVAEGRLADTRYKGTYMLPSARSVTWTNSVGSFDPEKYDVSFMTPEEVEEYAEILVENGTITNVSDLYDLAINFKTFRKAQRHQK